MARLKAAPLQSVLPRARVQGFHIAMLRGRAQTCAEDSEVL